MSMHRNKILDFITSEIAPDVKPEEIAPGYDLFEGGILDSLAMVRLVAWLGATFRIQVNEVDVVPDELVTIEAIERFVETHEPVAVKTPT